MNANVSEGEFAIESHALVNQRGEVYHVIPAERCRVGIVTRFDGRMELAWIRNRGAWLPGFFPEMNSIAKPDTANS